MCAGPEDGDPAAWWWCDWGEKGESDPQMSAEHLGCDRSASLWHAGERRTHHVWPTALHLFLLVKFWVYVAISQVVTLELLCFISFTEGSEDFEYHWSVGSGSICRSYLQPMLCMSECRLWTHKQPPAPYQQFKTVKTTDSVNISG